MMKKKIYFVALLTIILFSLTITMEIRVNEQTAIFQMTTLPSTLPSNLEIDSYLMTETPTDYVFFAKSDAEFQDLLSLQPSIVYENLQAVVLEKLPSEIGLFELSMPNRIFPYNSYKSATSYASQSSSITLDNGAIDNTIVDIQGLWDLNYKGSGVTVAVFDNGVQADHPGLAGQVLTGANFNIYDGIEKTICQDHGTPVSGNIASTGLKSDGSQSGYLGMAPASKIYPVNIGCDGPNNGQLWGDLLAGFDHILANNATIDVVNTSWGGGNAAIWIPVVEKLADENIILVGSSGNSGPDRYTSGGPGAAVEAISAGGIDHNLNLWSASSRGPVFGLQFKPDILAPSVDVMTTQKGSYYGAISGTSFSSPLTAGAIATLISALQGEGIPYNPGVIKAALMRTAITVGAPELDQGKGYIQAKKAYDLINNAYKGTGGIPTVVEMSPRLDTQPISFLQTIFTNLQTDFPITIISSHPAETTIEISGDLANIMTFDQNSINTNRYSQNVKLHINTIGKQVKIYNGSVTVKIGTHTSVAASYSVNVKGDAKAKILMDLGHTTWDTSGADVRGGANTGEFIQRAVGKNIWVEEWNGTITSNLLKNYDVLWMPDPMSIDYSDPSDIEAIRANPLTIEEINAIVAFVKAGGSLFTDFNGKLEGSDINYPVGTNAEIMNTLMNNFGINLVTTPEPILEDSLTASTLNVSSPVGATNKITHNGNYLEVSGNAIPLAEIEGRVTTAIYDAPGEGRVIATSTNYWLDNVGIVGGYPGEEDDSIFANNVLDWLTSSTQVKFISSIKEGNTITGKFQILENRVPVTTAPTVKRLANRNLESEVITTTSAGDGIWQFTYSSSQDGVHELQVARGKDYARWEMTLDRTAPSIEPNPSNPNMVTLPKRKTITLQFTVTDNLATLNTTDFGVLLNGTDRGKSIEYSYTPSNKMLIIILNSPVLEEPIDNIYDVSIFATDDFQNTAEYHYYFTFKEGLFSPISSTKEDDSLNPWFVALAIITVPIIKRKRKFY